MIFNEKTFYGFIFFFFFSSLVKDNHFFKLKTRHSFNTPSRKDFKIYHPEETLKYHISSTYCKAVYLNSKNFLEVEIITDDSLDHVEDDSLQYNFSSAILRRI